jgi:serine/threonine protein kinase
MQAVQN